MKRNLLTVIMIASIMIVPAVATASVMISDPISVTVSHTGVNSVYVEKGSGYAVAHKYGFFTMVGNNKKQSNFSLDINDVNGTGNMSITNVLEIVGNVHLGTYVNVTVTSNLPAGVYLYCNSAPSKISTSGTISGTNVSATSSSSFTVEIQSGTVVYLSFLVDGGSKGTGRMTFSYGVTS